LEDPVLEQEGLKNDFALFLPFSSNGPAVLGRHLPEPQHTSPSS
jgi:hypothetical protein